MFIVSANHRIEQSIFVLTFKVLEYRVSCKQLNGTYLVSRLLIFWEESGNSYLYWNFQINKFH